VIKIKKIIFIILISAICLVKSHAEIKDGLFATVGNKAITYSDVVNEIKIILILNNESYSDDKRDRLHKLAMSSIIKRSIKQIAIDQNDFLVFKQQELESELTKLARNINMDLDTLKNICASNDLDFSLVENQMKVELLWNSLIFQLYKDRLSINVEEIDDQLKLIQNKKEFEEYLISEIIIKAPEEDKMKTVINELKNRIEIEGFENVAMNLSISQTSTRGGNLGWLNENQIPKKFKSKIVNTPVGKISEPTLLPQGIIIFKVRDKRKVEKSSDLEKEKDLIVAAEKTKILNMYSLSHYDSLRRSIAVKFLTNE
tara:strand:+ start:4658 stop:5602 length:945 start_codon:yes stop_codon:yes gene_type:complete